MLDEMLQGEEPEQVSGTADAPVEPGEGEDFRSRNSRRIQELLEQNKREREEMRAEQARLREELAFIKGQASKQQEPKFDIESISDPEERQAAYLAQTKGEVAALRREIEQTKAEKAHSDKVTAAMKRLDFGDEQSFDDAQEMVSNYARAHNLQETRAFAERTAARFKPQPKDKKPSPEQEWAKQKEADRKATASVPRGVPTIPAGPAAAAKPKAKESSAELYAKTRAKMLEALGKDEGEE